MKNISIYIRQLTILSIFLSLVIVSCTEDEEGTPSISNIRVVPKDSAISAGEFGLLIAIQGTNLGSVHKVYFNDLEAQLIPTFVTNTNIILPVPSEGPNEINNKVTLVTRSGKSVTADFNVILPKPIINQLYNEFPKPGSETSVLGQYFFVIEKVLIGDKEAEILKQSPEEIRIKLPDQIGTEHVTVIGAGGSTTSAFRLNETVGNLVNFDIPATGWGSDVCWGDAERVSPENSSIDPISGKYTQIKQTKLPPSGYQGDWVISTCWYDFGLAPGDHTSKVFRFEAYVGEPWKSGFYNLILKNESGTEFKYEWKPWNNDKDRSTGFKTTGWQTFYIPLSNFVNKDADPQDQRIADVSKIRDLYVAFSNGAEGATEIPSHFVAMDNFRIVDSK